MKILYWKTKDQHIEKGGFTLLEIIVVIGIVSVLALTMVPNISAYRANAENKQVKVNVKGFWDGASTVDKLEKGYEIKPGEFGDNNFKIKAGEYANVDKQEELDKYTVGKDGKGIFVEYKHRNGLIYKYPEDLTPIKPGQGGVVVNPDETVIPSEPVTPDIYPETRTDFVKSATILPYALWNIPLVKEKVNEMELNTVNVAVRVLVDSVSSNNMTLHEGDVTHAITLIKELNKMGVDVILEPFPWIANGSIGEHEWNPSDINSWFWNWKTVVLKPLIDRVAKPHNVDFLTVSNNFIHMEYASGYWRNTFSDVKNSYGYSGEIIYKTNWWVTATWDSVSTNAYNTKVNNNLFSSPDLDVISIAAYFELTTTANPSVEEIKSNLIKTTKYNRGQNIYQEIKNFNSIHGKDIFFGELGTPNYAGYASEPWNPTPSGYGGATSATAQYSFFKAYIETFGGQDWYKGFTIFAIGDDNSHYNLIHPNAVNYIKGLK